MHKQTKINKKTDKLISIAVIVIMVMWLGLNILFFYTDWWEVYLKPIGFHNWLDSISWFHPYYNDLETRLYEHDVNVHKYMILLSWGAAISIILGLILSAILMYPMLNHYLKIDPTKKIPYISLSVFILGTIAVPYVALTTYAKPASTYLGHMFYPRFFSLLWFQVVYLGSIFLLLVVFPAIFHQLYKNSKQSQKTA